MAYYAQGGPIPLFHRAEAINSCARKAEHCSNTVLCAASAGAMMSPGCEREYEGRSPSSLLGSALIFSALIFRANAAPPGHEIKHLPGWDQPLPSRHFAGYIDAGTVHAIICEAAHILTTPASETGWGARRTSRMERPTRCTSTICLSRANATRRTILVHIQPVQALPHLRIATYTSAPVVACGIPQC
jgi:hypothetical protein